jgi:hypothetical protein
MHQPKPKRKISSEINIYREACRNLVASHPKLSPLRRVILMRLTHYINRHTWDAYVSEETLAKDCRTTTRTVRRALEDGKGFRIIERTRRGSHWTGASHHVFTLSKPDINRTGQAVNRTGEASKPDSSVPLTSEEHLNNLPPAASSFLENSAAAGRQGVGEKLRWTRPVIYGERPRTPEDSYELEEVYERGDVPRRYWRAA